MRAMIFAVILAMLPAVANAQTDNSVTVPLPTISSDTDGYRIAAIAAGAVGGVIVANLVTGGLATPVIAGSFVANSALTTISQLAATVVGAVGGGYVGNWLYDQ